MINSLTSMGAQFRRWWIVDGRWSVRKGARSTICHLLSTTLCTHALTLRRVISLACVAALLTLAACTEPPDAETILARARAFHGSSVLDDAVVTFRFRDARFRIRRRDGRFTYARTYRDSLGRRVREGLTNDSLFRFVEGQPVALSAEERAAVATDVNSVVYFALLPYFLDASAVQARHTGVDTIRGVPYYRVAVTFQQESGGRDWQDRFLYWFDQEDYSMDYLAYAYGLGPGEEPGTRFRTAFNARRIGGVRFADYRNYTADTLAPSRFAAYPSLWAAGALDSVSTVALDSIRVRPLRTP